MNELEFQVADTVYVTRFKLYNQQFAVSDGSDYIILYCARTRNIRQK